jgi:hypothetical protein
MSRVYSTRFLAVQGASENYDYVVPDGQLAIIRSIDMWMGTPVAAPRAYVGITQGTAFVTILALFGPPIVDVNLHWSGRQVAYPGDKISFVYDSLSPDVTVSGYLLDLP